MALHITSVNHSHFADQYSSMCMEICFLNNEVAIQSRESERERENMKIESELPRCECVISNFTLINCDIRQKIEQGLIRAEHDFCHSICRFFLAGTYL